MVNVMTSVGIWLFLFTFFYGQWTIETVYGVSFTTTSQYSGLIEEGVSNTHNWAVNLPELEFVVTTDVINIPPASATIEVTLTLNSSATLSGNVVVLDDTTCIRNPSPPNFVVDCKKSSGSALIVTAIIKNVTDIFNEAVLTLVDRAGSISGWNYPPATLVLKECDIDAENTIPVTSQSTCGFQCEANFTCNTGYQMFENKTYVCLANATWSPTLPSPLCISETTTSAPSTTIEYAEPTTTDASNGNSTDKSTEPTTTAPSNSDSTDNSTGSTTMDDPGRNNGGNTGLHPGWIAAIVIVSVAVLGGAGYGGYLLYKKKNGGYIGGNAD